MKENRQMRKTLARIRSGHGKDAARESRRLRVSAAQLPDIVGSPAEHLTKLTRGHDAGMSRARAQLRDRRELSGNAWPDLGTVPRDARLILIVSAPAEHTLGGGRAAVIGSRRDPIDAREPEDESRDARIGARAALTELREVVATPAHHLTGREERAGVGLAEGDRRGLLHALHANGTRRIREVRVAQLTAIVGAPAEHLASHQGAGVTRAEGNRERGLETGDGRGQMSLRRAAIPELPRVVGAPARDDAPSAHCAGEAGARPRATEGAGDRTEARRRDLNRVYQSRDRARVRASLGRAVSDLASGVLAPAGDRAAEPQDTAWLSQADLHGVRDRELRGHGSEIAVPPTVERPSGRERRTGPRVRSDPRVGDLQRRRDDARASGADGETGGDGHRYGIAAEDQEAGRDDEERTQDAREAHLRRGDDAPGGVKAGEAW